MDYQYTIICTACGAVRSQGGLDQPATVPDVDVLKEAAHNANCLLVQTGNGTVSRQTDNPTNIVYSITTEVQ